MDVMHEPRALKKDSAFQIHPNSGTTSVRRSRKFQKVEATKEPQERLKETTADTPRTKLGPGQGGQGSACIDLLLREPGSVKVHHTYIKGFLPSLQNGPFHVDSIVTGTDISEEQER